MKFKKVYLYIGIIFFSSLLFFLSFNRHSRAGIKNYHAQIWADKAGYYVYLPYLFIYSCNPSLMPDSIDIHTGNGFFINRLENKLFTKYTYGTAFMQLPFFAITHLIVKYFTDYNSDGFSLPYNKMIDIAGVFYLLLGLFYAFRVLRLYTSEICAFIGIFLMFAATNLYYYGIDETGMSHIYSFFWFSFMLYHLKGYIVSCNDKKPELTKLFFVALAFSFIILIRPVNILPAFFILFLDVSSFSQFKDRLKFLFLDKKYRYFIFPSALIIIPQFLFWSYNRASSGVNIPYQNEGFTNILNPQLLKVWFSTNNGLFTYNPFWFILILSFVIYLMKKKEGSILYLIVFFVISYLIGAWWQPELGCGFGNRAFVEFLPFFIIPFANLLTEVNQKIRWLIVLCTLICAIWNLKLTYTWDGCWYGNYWDWQLFFEILLGPAK